MNLETLILNLDYGLDICQAGIKLLLKFFKHVVNRLNTGQWTTLNNGHAFFNGAHRSYPLISNFNFQVISEAVHCLHWLYTKPFLSHCFQVKPEHIHECSEFVDKFLYFKFSDFVIECAKCLKRACGLDEKSSKD